MSARSILIVAPYGFHDRMPNFIEFVTARVLAKNGWSVTALTRAEGTLPDHANILGIDVHRYHTTKEGLMTCLHLIRKRPTVVHVHNLRNNRVGVIAAMLAKVFHIPLFFTEYGLPHDHYLSADRDDPFEKPFSYDNVISTLGMLCKRLLTAPQYSILHLRNYFFHWPLFHANKIIFVSKHNMPIAEKLGLKNFVLLPHILDSDRWKIPARAGVENETPSIPQKPFVLFVGQIKERKGWQTYLKAIQQVPESMMPTFVLATQSPDISECTTLIKTLGVEKRVVVMHRAPNETLHALFEHCEVVVVPSYYEGFGLVPLEAFESEKPVVATNVEALTDFLVDGVNARLVASKNPTELAGALRSINTGAAQIIAGGIRTLAELRSPSAHRQWLSLYEQLL